MRPPHLAVHRCYPIVTGVLLVPPSGGSVHHRDFWTPFQGIEVDFEHSAFVDIVRIEKGDEFTDRGPQSNVPSRRGSSCKLGPAPKHFDASILGSRKRSYGRALVSRSIIDEQQLPLRESLGLNAGDRILQKRFGVQKGSDYRDLWAHTSTNEVWVYSQCESRDRARCQQASSIRIVECATSPCCPPSCGSARAGRQTA